MSSPIVKAVKRHSISYEDYDATRRRRRSSFGAALGALPHELWSERVTEARRRRTIDRFLSAPLEKPQPVTATPRSHRMAKAFGLAGDRRLRCHSPTPPNGISAPLQILQSYQKFLTKSLYELPEPPSLTSAATNLVKVASLTLSAPGMCDDFYTRAASWSKSNLLAVATGSSVNVRNMRTSTVNCVCKIASLELVSCLEWSPDSNLLALGVSFGEIRVMDMAPEKMTRINLIPENFERDVVGGISWASPYELVAGYESGKVRRFDTRAKRFPLGTIHATKTRVSGVKWNADSTLLATGSGDGTVLCWDSRQARKPVGQIDHDLGPQGNILRTDDGALERRWRGRKHKSTVKGMSWCPWQPDMLATAGGTMDGTIRFWSSSTGTMKRNVIRTESQISSLQWSHSCKEILSTHGYAFETRDSVSYNGRRRHSVLVHNYPTGEVVGRIFDVGHGRISDSCLSPDGTKVITCGADETIRLYTIFGPEKPAANEPDELWMQNSIR